MFVGNVVVQSAGSLSVVVLAFIMVFLQVIFLFRKTHFAWYGWSAAISFCSMVYAVGIFLEYNALPGPVNGFAGLLEFTAIIGLVHCFYGFTFAYLGMKSRMYHYLAGAFHGLLLILLWCTSLIVADKYVIRHFFGLTKPFVELDLGPLGPAFMIYAILASMEAIVLWIRHKGPDPRHKALYLGGATFWTILGIHDGLAAWGLPTMQYLMEYGFCGFSVVVLWVVFSSFVDRSAEDKYRVITEYANDAILVIQDGITVFGNPACNSLIGHQITDSSAGDFLDDVAPEDRERVRNCYRGLKSLAISSDLLTIRIIRPSREERFVEARASAIRYRNRPAILIVMRDATERIRKEEALRESEEKLSRLRKMESLGLLAGGVAHDLNNVLSGIVGYPDLMLLRLPADSELRKPLEAIKNSGRRAAEIVHDLLTIARGVAIPKQPLNLNDVIEGYLKSPEYKKLLQYHEALAVTVDLDPRLFNIKGSPIHIRKTIMNLVSNAAEAIKDSGVIVVSTVNCYVDRPLRGYEEVNVGEYVLLAVTDNGPGIASDDLQRVFEPFYTKKAMGRSGTGLGLTVVWNVVQDHEGYIDLQSNENGSRFELYFPATRAPMADGASPVPQDLHGHGETTLVIDDVESQREILCSMLEVLGYKAKAFSGGEEAVDYLKEHTADLLLLDMIMDPGISGLETYKRIKEIHPDQKAIIISGFAETEQVKETLRIGAGRYIKKPLILEELGLAVQEELKKKAG